MINRKQALAVIRYEYATHGKETRDSMPDIYGEWSLL